MNQVNKRATFRVKLTATAVILALIVPALDGCATNAQTGAAVGGTGACVLAMAMEKDPKKRAAACAVAGTAGAAVGYLIGRQRDLALARETAARIQASQPGMVAVQMRTQNVAVPPENRGQFGNASAIESLNAMVISVPVAQVQRMEPKAANTLSMIGKYVSGAQENSHVVVSALTPADYDFMVQSMQRGYDRQVPSSKVVYEYRQLNRGTQATVEVMPVSA